MELHVESGLDGLTTDDIFEIIGSEDAVLLEDDLQQFYIARALVVRELNIALEEADDDRAFQLEQCFDELNALIEEIEKSLPVDYTPPFRDEGRLN